MGVTVLLALRPPHQPSEGGRAAQVRKEPGTQSLVCWAGEAWTPRKQATEGGGHTLMWGGRLTSRLKGQRQDRQRPT